MLFRNARTDYGKLANSAKILQLAAVRYAETFSGYTGGPVTDGYSRQVLDDLVLITRHVAELQARIATARSGKR